MNPKPPPPAAKQWPIKQGDHPDCPHWGFCQAGHERGQIPWTGCPVDCTHRMVKK